MARNHGERNGSRNEPPDRPTPLDHARDSKGRKADREADLAKAPASDSIMTSDKMKPLLALSKREPVQAAIALTTDGDALLLLDKKAKPKKVLSMLRGHAGKAKLALNSATLRFGRAEVDTDYDSSMVRLFVNKETPGNMRIKLVELVKRIAYQKVEINVDPSLEEEPEEDTEAQEGVATAPTPGSTAPEPPVATAPPPAPPPPPPAPPAAAQDEATLRRALGELIARIPAAAGDDATRKATLLKVAGMANDQLKAHNAEGAAATMDKLCQVLGAAAPTAAPPVDLARWTAARSAWQDASDTVDGQISALQKMLRESGDEELEEIAEYGLNGITGNHKVPLMAALMEIGAGSAESIAKGRPKAIPLIQAFRTHIESDERVAACDDNPGGVAVSIRATLVPALAGLEAALAA